MKVHDSVWLTSLALVGADGWHREVVVQSAPSNMYLLVGSVMAVTCAVFIVLVLQYGLKR